MDEIKSGSENGDAENRVVVFVEFDEAEAEAVCRCADEIGVPVEALARTLLAARRSP